MTTIIWNRHESTEGIHDLTALVTAEVKKQLGAKSCRLSCQDRKWQGRSLTFTGKAEGCRVVVFAEIDEWEMENGDPFVCYYALSIDLAD
jgi:hypothetical protein